MPAAWRGGAMGILRGMKRSFWRGLAALLPSLLTLVVLVLGLSFVYRYLGQPVNTAIMHIVHWVFGIPVGEYDAAGVPMAGSVLEWYSRYYLWWVGPVAAIIGLTVGAYFLGTFIGSRLLRFLEGWIVRVPLLRRIYPGAKQVSEFFFSERTVEFRRVVAMEYPRRGVWSVGFVTGRSFRALSEKTEQELITVFVPSSPTPFTGYIVCVPRREVIDLPITVEEAFQYAISGGVVMPPAERLESLSVALSVSGEEARRNLETEKREADASASQTEEPREGEQDPQET
jgi:uncharacterized membrane protein